MSTVPSEFVEALLLPLRGKGVDIVQFAQGAGVELPDPDAQISTENYNRLVLAVMSWMHDESGGVGPVKTPYGTTRMLIYALLNCATLEQAMGRAIEFLFACLESPDSGLQVELEVDQDQRVAKLVYHPGDDTPVERGRPEAILCSLAIWVRVCSWLVGKQIEILGAECMGNQKETMPLFNHFMSCPISYDAPANSISFSSNYLRLPIVRNEMELEHFLRNAPYQVIVAAGTGEESIVSRVKNLLQTPDMESLPGFEEMASQLGMSARTLRRRLEDEGTSYQQIKDNMRRDQAIQLLTRTSSSVSDIAADVGFSDASAFHRSFRKWTGLAPGDYRQQFGLERGS